MKIEEFIYPTQDELFMKLLRMFKEKAVYKLSNYILVKGDAPIMLLAHMDTVHTERVRHICKSKDGQVLMSPQGIGGDDRCGIYALVTIYQKSKVKPWLLFTCDEETGGHGARKFCKDYNKGSLPKELSSIKCMIEIDRKGKDDAVYYDCANDDFEDFITNHGFKTSYGTFSDISVVAPELKVAAVNLSSGYYNAHTQHEYINRRDLSETIKKVCCIVAESTKGTFCRYEYIENPYAYKYRNYAYYGGYNYYNARTPKKKKTFKDPFDEIMYNELLDYYTETELDLLIAKEGIGIIKKLYDEDVYKYSYTTKKGTAWDDD